MSNYRSSTEEAAQANKLESKFKNSFETCFKLKAMKLNSLNTLRLFSCLKYNFQFLFRECSEKMTRMREEEDRGGLLIQKEFINYLN